MNDTVRRQLPTDLNALASTLEMNQRDPRMAIYMQQRTETLLGVSGKQQRC